MITCLVGLPGSGKTWYAKNVLRYDVFIDDPKCKDDFPSILGSNMHMVIADPMLCCGTDKYSAILKEKYPEHEIEFIFFENDPEKCKNNVIYRNDGRKVHITASMLEKAYTIPHGAKVIPIWSPNGS